MFIGGVNVQNIDKTVLMNTVSFVFQNSRLIKGTILDNVKMARPDATNEEVLQAIHKAQCDDIIKKFPEGINTDEEWAEIRPWLRPVLLSIVKSKKVLLEGVTFKNSPSWCLHPLSCEDFTVNNIMVINPWYSQNGDAIDLESCKNALIINSVFDAGDDAICIKSGKDEDGRRRGEPCQNVIVKNNTVLHGHGGFVVGSEMSGGVKNLSLIHI